MEKERIEWIDTLKGIGILLVVASHVFGGKISTYSAWFHMPLFFFISGYLYKPNGSSREFVKRRARHLLVPYATYLVLLSVPGYLAYASAYFNQDPNTPGSEFLWFTAKLLWGGPILGGNGGEACLPFGIFWFVTCLFLTQIAYNELHKRLRGKLLLILPVIVVAYILAMLDSANVDFKLIFARLGVDRRAFHRWAYPWCANVVLLAIVYFTIGDAASRVKAGTPRKWIRPMKLLLSAAVAATVVTLNLKGNFRPRMGMKFAAYGIPGISFALTVSLIAISHELARAVSRAAWLKPVNAVLVECGKASMVIMFLHTIIHMDMAKYPPLAAPWLRFMVSVGAPYILFRLFSEAQLTRRLFLGTSR